MGVVSLLWNAMGAVDFTMTELHSETYLKGFTAEQREYFFGFPFWVVVSWGIATWGSLLGSLLLLLRKAAAFHLFVASFVCIFPTMLYNYVLTDGLKVMGGGTGAVLFSAVIVAVAFLLFGYARKMRRSGVLR